MKPACGGKGEVAAGEEFRAVARRNYRALAAALRREIARGEMKCELAWGDRLGYI
jgi:hypothetical protein